jgi:tetratricopeptide (TPR) repeat protein
MKAERRHELKQNTLAHSLETLPDVGRKHGTKILVVITVGLAVALLIRSRVTSSRAAAESAAYAIGDGRESIDQLKTYAERQSPAQGRALALAVLQQVDKDVQKVLDSTDDPKLVAEARLLQGDVNWELAALPEAPGASTRPDLALPKSDEQFLQSAMDAYQSVVDNAAAPQESKISARLGLAAVWENRRQFDKAKEQYQKVLDDTATPKPLKDLAASAISRLEIIRKPALLAQPAQEPVVSGAMIPATTAPSTTQSTQPATTPSTVPATAPQAPNNPG